MSNTVVSLASSLVPLSEYDIILIIKLIIVIKFSEFCCDPFLIQHMDFTPAVKR